MTDAPGIVDFIRARLEDEEAWASACTETSGQPHGPWGHEKRSVYRLSGGKVAEADNILFATHIALHDPSRTLRDVAAHRALLELHAGDGGHECPAAQDAWGSRTVYEQDCPTLRIIAGIWRDHPSWRSEWSVTP